jgi:hypothetical protein
MRKYLVPLLTVAFTGVTGAQTPASLSYRGWALGISRDSAISLARSQNGQVLDCVGNPGRSMYCRTAGGAQPDISAYFSGEPRVLEMVTILEQLPPSASADSLGQWFRGRWGEPRPLAKRDSTSTSTTLLVTLQWLGMWYGAAGGVASANITTSGDKRVLGVVIDNPLRYLRGRPPQPKARTIDDPTSQP